MEMRPINCGRLGSGEENNGLRLSKLNAQLEQGGCNKYLVRNREGRMVGVVSSGAAKLLYRDDALREPDLIF